MGNKARKGEGARPGELTVESGGNVLAFGRCPHCGKPLCVRYGASIATLFRRRPWLVCEGWPRCDYAKIRRTRAPWWRRRRDTGDQIAPPRQTTRPTA